MSYSSLGLWLPRWTVHAGQYARAVVSTMFYWSWCQRLCFPRVRCKVAHATTIFGLTNLDDGATAC